MMDSTVRAFETSYSCSLSAQPFLPFAAAPSQTARILPTSCRLANRRPLHGVGLACLY